MIIVDEEEALTRVNSPSNLKNRLSIQRLHSNNTAQKLTAPIQDLVVGIAAISTQAAAGAEFGVSQQNVSHLKLAGYGKETLETIHSKTLDAMLQAVDLIPEKLATTKKATDVSQVAANLARVLEKTSPRVKNESSVKVVVYAPRIKSDSEYEEVAV